MVSRGEDMKRLKDLVSGALDLTHAQAQQGDSHFH